jgi:hypothetical protein
MSKSILGLIIILTANLGIAGMQGFHYIFDKPLFPVPELKGAGVKINGGLLKSEKQSSFLQIPGSAGVVFGPKGGTLVLVCRFADRSPDLKRFQFICNKDNSFFLGITNNQYNFSLCQNKRWSIALIGGEPPIDGRWLHLAAVARRINEPEQGNVGFQLELYVNGERIMSKFAPCNTPKPDMTTPVTLGNASLRYGFLGDIAEAAFYDRAMSPSEIETSVKVNKLVKALPADFSDLIVQLKTELDNVLKKAKTPLSRWAVKSLGNAGHTGFDQKELLKLCKRLVPVLEENLPDNEFAKKWNDAQSRLKLINTPKLLAMIINGKSEKTFPIVSVYNKANKSSVFGTKTGEWRIDYRNSKNKMLQLKNHSDGVKSTVSDLEISPDGATFKIKWENIDFDIFSPVSIHGGRIEMGFEVENKTRDKLIVDVTFPAFRFARLPGKNDTFVYPNMSGILIADPTETFSYDQIFPDAHNTMQFRAYYDDKGNGIYLALEDPLARVKYSSDSGRRKQMFCSWRNPVSYDFGVKGGNSYKQSGKAVVEIYRGDWFNAGQIYKRFLCSKARWWISNLPRQDTPKWFRDNCINILAGVWQGDKTLLYLRDYFGMDLGIHLVGWTPKRNWPHFDKATPKAQALLKSLHIEGIRVWPYSDPRLWALTDSEDLKSDWQYTSHGKPLAIKQKDGSVYTELYNVKCAVMCPAAKGCHDWIIQAGKKIAEYGFDGIYHDQLGGGRPVMCFDRTHGHKANDPRFWLENGYWKIYADLRAEIRKINPDFIHTAEDAADPHLKEIDGYMAWRFLDANHVPLFQSLYAGRVQFVGRLFNHQYPGDWNSSFAKVAEQLVFGEQLGWITLEDLEAASPLRCYFKKLAHLRKALLGYFNEADMLHPLSFKKTVSELTAVWGNCKSKNYIVKTPKVLHSVWQRRDGKIMIIFVNTVNEEMTVEPVIKFDKKILFVCRYGNPSPQIIDLKNGKIPAVKLAPYTSEVWLLDDNNNSAEAKAVAAVLDKISRYDNGKTLRVLGSVRLHDGVKPLQADSRKYLKVKDAKRFRNAYRRPAKAGGTATDNGDIVLMVQSGGSISYPAVEFGSQAFKAFDVLIAADRSNAGGTIEFFITGDDGATKRSIGKITVENTGGWYTFKNIRVALSEKISGKNNILIKFQGNACCFKGWRGNKK